MLYTNGTVVERKKSAPKSERPRGRPRRVDAPVVPWDVVDRLLVHGEKHEDAKGEQSLVYPSLRELARRYGVSPTRMWQYAAQARCYDRRKEAKATELIRYDRLVSARRAEARALGTKDVVRVADAFIEGFEKKLNEGKVRFDNPADLDKMVRLKELLLGNADGRQEIQGGLTLEAIQERHRRLRTQREGFTADMMGTGENAADDSTPAELGAGANGAHSAENVTPAALPSGTHGGEGTDGVVN